jgi:ABC-type oligopeptide transport system substrate-binding subunit
MARIKACYRERDRKFRTKSINLQEVDENIVGNGPFTYSSHNHNRAI